jgi:TetR/AcrR family transcriptional regulator
VTSVGPPPGEWVEKAVERSAAVQRSRLRIAHQVQELLEAAGRLIHAKGDEFTTQELCAEAGVALQTFYRYFASKDELLLAVIGDAMNEACRRWAKAAAALPDPLTRLKYYLTSTLEPLDAPGADAAKARFIVTTRWHLHRHYAKELAEAEQPLVELLRAEVNAALDAGLLTSSDPDWDPWFLADLARSVFHFYAFAPRSDGELDVVKERLWRFCLTALGGADPT